MKEIQVACFGAAHRDIKSQALQKIIIRSSNPVRSESTWGGVARNIAENLARLGVKVTMVSRVGADRQGAELRSFLEDLNIDTSAFTLSLTNSTASYTALIGVDADMYVALADMEIYNELTPQMIEPYIDKLCLIPIWVVDLNLPLETMRYLADKAPEDCIILTMPVSVAKISRIEPILPKTHTLVLNRLELSHLVKIDADKAIDDALNTILAKGVSNVIVTDGSNDVILATANGEQFSLPIPETALSDTIGGGDALAAGYLFGLLEGLDLQTSLAYGVQAGRLTVSTKCTVHPELDKVKLKESILA